MNSDTDTIINLIYETAEDVELWPKLLGAVNETLDHNDHSRNDHSNNENRKNSHTDDDPFQPHLDRALRLNQRLSHLENQAGAAHTMFDLLPMAIVTVDARCHVATSNTLAQKIIHNSHLLALDAGRLTQKAPHGHGSLNAIVASALDSRTTTDAKVATKLVDPHSQETLSIFAVRAKGQDNSASSELCALFIISNFLPQYVDATVLVSVYGLTPAETRLAQKLAGGDSLTDIAEQLGLAHNTVRNQLKSVFSKTDTKRQAELVGLILSTPSHLNIKKAGLPSGSRASVKTSPKQSITLTDGYVVEYFDIGAREGKIFLYSHEFMAWDWWNLIDEHALAMAGIRLIAPLRPGYAGTHAAAKHCFSDWNKRIKHLLDHLSITQFSAVGFSSGGPFAASNAYYLPSMCDALILVNSTAPIAKLSDLDAIKPTMSKLVVGFAKYSPRVYQRFFQALLTSVTANPQTYIRDYMKHWSAFDAQLVANPAVLQNLVERFNECIHHGAKGLVREAVVVTQDWGFALSDILVPTTLWVGEHDRALPAVMQSQLTSIPNCDIKRLPKAGHMVMLQYWDAIFASAPVQNVAQPAKYPTALTPPLSPYGPCQATSHPIQ